MDNNINNESLQQNNNKKYKTYVNLMYISALALIIYFVMKKIFNKPKPFRKHMELNNLTIHKF